MNLPETCQRQYKVVTWFIASGIIISEFILVLRTSRYLTFIPAIVVTDLELKSLIFIPSDFPGCRLSAAGRIIIVSYILLALSETTMAVLTCITAYRHLRHSQSRWVTQLYKDGLLFYVYLLSISIANVLVPILAPRIFANWLATPQRVMHSVLCNRVLLMILKQRSSSALTNRLRPFRETASSDPVFTSFVDEEISANITIASPTVDTVFTQHLDVELQIIERPR
ncbi:hypothetical protein CPB84DRAFT_1787148 [Gymnopilus junonius]|uniref:Uncharacterized protein n=1 Tax=Gymnopilus junonius TaxID=109634 RepID=A0A9P5TKU2_GYMJU|nr:hypothetical protein CPB84DRAFT_1787148 [Gymnopilus junonius]